MLLPIASLFSACGNSDGYNLNKLDNDFNQIVETNNNLVNNDGKFEFDYSSHEKLENIIENYEPYKQLNSYNYVFYNIMAFAYEYVPTCANNISTKNSQIKDQVQSDLKALKKSIGDVNNCVNIFAEMVIVASADQITSPACLTRYENLLDAYNVMLEDATNFNNSLSNLYFNNILKDGNPNVYSYGVDKFDANIVVNKLKARLKYQISCLSQSFVEMYVDGSLASKIANGETSFDLGKYNYKSNVEAISLKSYTEQIAAEKGNNESNKSQFYELSVQAQNIQTVLNNDRNKFVKACNSIQYSIVLNNENASAYEKTCVEIIESNYNLISIV